MTHYWPDQKHANLEYCLEQMTVNGLIMEFGVYTGSTIKTIAHKCPDRIVYGFDSFYGLPENYCVYPAGSLSLNGVAPELPSNVELVTGLFKDTLPSFPKQQVAFIHIDCDLYSSTKTILENFKDYFVEGTIIVFDEYAIEGFTDALIRDAWQEFVAENNVSFDFLSVVPGVIEIRSVVIK